MGFTGLKVATGVYLTTPSQTSKAEDCNDATLWPFNQIKPSFQASKIV